MERSEWLKKMRARSKAMYDRFAPVYWVRFGVLAGVVHRQYIEKFLGHMRAQSTLLDAGCGAGLYDEMLLKPGHSVLGIDQSSGMLARAREIFPQERFPHLVYKKMGLQEMDFKAEFDGAICMDAMEHVSPEDWPGILVRFQKALKPRGVLYITVDATGKDEIQKSFDLARAQGLPVVFGEVADQIDANYEKVMALDYQSITGEVADPAVYHFHPTFEQVRTWLNQAAFNIEEEGSGDEYEHFLASIASPK
jgi:SAM-dependent methyltransferase